MIPPVVALDPAGRRVEKTCGPGFLEIYTSELGELPVLHVAGTPEEMGRQYGCLAAGHIRANADRMVGFFMEAGLPEALVHVLLDKCWRRLAPHAPERFLREMAAVAEGAQEAGVTLSVADLERITTVTNFDLYRREERIIEFLGEDAGPLLEQMGGPNPMSCTMFAVWGARTVDGKMFAHRDLDWASQTGIHADRLVTVYRPAEGHAFATMDYAGVLGGLAGLNEKGISLAEVGAFSAAEELDGTPWIFIARRVLEEAACLEDAIAIIEGAKHTIGYNYLIADGDPERFGTPEFKPRAAAFETNFECCTCFFDDDPKEHEAVWRAPGGREVRYGLPLKHAIMRGDTAFGARNRELQAADNGPADPACDGDPTKEVFGNSYLECHKPMHDLIRAYETGAEYVFPVRGTKIVEAGAPRKIGPEEALTIAATVAHNTEKLHDNDWNVMSAVYAPTDREFWVSYESCDDGGNWKNAPDSGYWHFALPELLEARPD